MLCDDNNDLKATAPCYHQAAGFVSPLRDQSCLGKELVARRNRRYDRDPDINETLSNILQCRSSPHIGLCTQQGFSEGSKMDLGEAQYLKQRLTPQPGDVLYLHLSDLLIALRALVPKNLSMVLDYGCGGSPYRPLFGSCTYHRADLSGGNNLDFEYGPDAKLPSVISGYDCVLSTQVLEHVEDPETYLGECYRVLRPGGCLILTTHGLYEDHACPYDYWRWTVYGLKRVVENSGLKVQATKKLTTGPRSAVFLAERELNRLRFGAAGAYGKLLSIGVRTVRRLGSRRRHETCDMSFAANRVVDMEEPGHDMYVAIALLASRRE